MKTINGIRIGCRMEMATWYVAANPGTAILPIAKAVGPHGSTNYGYAIVHRALNAGLIEDRPDESTPANQYSLYVTEFGKQVIGG